MTPLLKDESVPWREAYYTQNITRDQFVDQRCIRTNEMEADPEQTCGRVTQLYGQP